MPDANLIYARTFDGGDGITFDVPWPNFLILPTVTHTGFGTETFNNPFDGPVVDGVGHGMGSYRHRLSWILKELSFPPSGDYKVDLWGKWKNAGSQGGVGLGLCLRVRDESNYLVARVTSAGTGSPTLELVKVINGVETQIGATYTGSPISATQLNNGKAIVRGRVEDLSDGNTRVSIFTDPLGAVGDGDRRIFFEGDLAALRGALPPGVELIGGTSTDVIVDNLEVYDFADEWGAPAPAAGTGWQVLIGNTLYGVDDATDSLEGLDPPVQFLGCGREYGAGKALAKFKVANQFHAGLLHPGLRVICYHDGAIRFNGYMNKGSRAANPGSEQQTWTAKDALWEGRKVAIFEDDATPARYYNVFDSTSDNRRDDRLGFTIGDVIGDLFDEYTDGVEGLRYFGAAPEDVGTLAYVQSDLNQLDAIMPDIAVQGTFLSAVQQLLASYMPNFQLIMDPSTKKWRFRKITELPSDVFELTAEHAAMVVSPDPDRCLTALKARGALREPTEPVWFEVTNDKVWTQAQEDNASTKKSDKRAWVVKLNNADDAAQPPIAGQPPEAVVYVDVPAGTFDEDDVRGAVVTVVGDAFPRWCVGNTSTRLWLSSPAWGGGTPPPFPTDDAVVVTMVDPDAVQALTAAGVGRAWFARPGTLCPGTSPLKASQVLGGIRNAACTRMRITYKDDDNVNRTQEYEAMIHTMSSEQTNAGLGCTPIIMAKQLPELGLINKAPGPGSVPPSPCAPGGVTGAKGLKVEVRAIEEEPDARCIRRPENDEEWRGPAYSEDETLWDGGGEPDIPGGDWGVRSLKTLPMPNFVSDTQDAGITLALDAILDLFSQKSYLFSVTYTTPWETEGLIRPGVGTDRFADLQSAIYVESAKRLTGFSRTEIDTPFPVYGVWWDVPGRKTILKAGTANGWTGITPGAFLKQLTEREAAIIAARAVKIMEDLRNCQNAKSKDFDGVARAAGPVNGCDVNVFDEVTKRVINVTNDDRDKKRHINRNALVNQTLERIALGIDWETPGEQPEIPGLDGAAELVDFTDGPVGKSLADHRIPFKGPTDHTLGQSGVYGGLPGSEKDGAYDAPETLFRKGGVEFRGKLGPGGSETGFIGVEFSVLDGDGAPTTWQDYDSNADLRASSIDPKKFLNSRSILADHEDEIRVIADEMRLIRDDDDLPLRPGDVGNTDYAEGAPPDLASYLRTAYANDLRPLATTWNDPGGLVFEGPMSGTDGLNANANMFWRVMVPENLLVQVEAVTAGTGTNSGDWDWAEGTYTDAPALRYLERGSIDIFHKQAGDFEDVSDSTDFGGTTGATSELTADTSNPWGMGGSRFQMPVKGTQGTVAAMFNLPPNIEGQVGVSVDWREHPSAALGNAATYEIDVWSMVAFSAWPVNGTNQASFNAVGNSGGDAQGQFQIPFSAVPPGLRKPYGPTIGVAAEHTGNGSSSGGRILIGGISVEVAIVEGGYLLRGTEPAMAISETVALNDTWSLETLLMSEAVAMTVEPDEIAESITLGESYVAELNPPKDLYELLTITEAIFLSMQQFAESMEITDQVDFEFTST